MTTENLLSLDEYTQLVADGAVDTVVCAVPDMYGRLLGKRLTTNSFKTLCLSGEGIHCGNYFFACDMDMNPVDLPLLTLYGHAWAGDIRLLPDMATMRRVPWEPNAVIVICDAFSTVDDSEIEVAPRRVLRRQIERAKAAGLALKAASELEFFLANAEASRVRDMNYRDIPMTSATHGDYQLLHSSKDDWFIHQIRTKMPQFGIPIESSKTEWGFGQQEVTMDYCDVLEMADRHVLFKHGVKELAHQNKLTASFMAKPQIDEIGSSCHIHASLWSADGEKPIGWDGDGMSDIFGSFLSGQLANALDLGLMFAPTINSYKRYRPDQFAGTAIAAGEDNRTTAFRIVGHDSSYRFENRIPGADVNPYFAYAAMFIAGLNGIDKNLPKPTLFSGNAWYDKDIPVFTGNFQDSVRLFGQSKVALDSLGELVHSHILGFYENELRCFVSETVTDWERERYYDRI
ncbi:glutamine synthetase family protein [Streptomyces sp. NPDC004610]|uniref:glutamine synthetase family protein n=1 Tax=unclassified Streptomyces TaxID=2593676 RepID=UPI0033B953E5